jgi:hypothetical protein
VPRERFILKQKFDMKKGKKRELRKIGIKKPFLYLVNSRLKSWEFKLKMWYENKRNKIVSNALTDIEKNEWVIRITNEYLYNINFLYRKTHGLKTIYGEIDQYTYRKYCILCNEYNTECNKQLKKINPILKLFFNIKSNQDTNHLKKFLNSGKLIVIKGLYKPTLHVIAKGNNYIFHREEKSDSNEISTLAISISDKVDNDIIRDIKVNK